MSRLTPIQLLLLNLASEIGPTRREYLTGDVAYEELKKLTGQDFGYDVRRWRQWFRETGKRIW
jgi:hypothetical protein